MPLTLRYYRRNIGFYIGGFVLFLVAILSATAAEKPAASMGDYILAALLCVALFLPFAAYHIYMYTSLRRAFAAAEPMRGTVVDWQRGAMQGMARLIIAADERVYRTPAVFGRLAARRWRNRAVNFAIGEDGYVFVFEILE